jgi:hypothetical protein
MPAETDWQVRLHAVDWPLFHTLYGAASQVPEQIERLRSPDESIALSGAADLRAGLCHQHVQIASATLPALPFILEALSAASDKVTVEILEMLVSFAVTTDPARMRQFASAVGKRRMPQPEWVGELRSVLRKALPRIGEYAAHENSAISELAAMFVEEMGKDAGSA